jgi:stage II sporulation protein AA (anti-sigma F factor antagonist)
VNVICECTNRNLVVKVTGEIDHHTSTIIREKIDKEFVRNNAKNIVFDFSGIDFMDSSGIGVIMGRYKSTQEIGGKVVIACVNSSLDRIFSISGLHKIVNTYESVEQALRSLA